MLYSITVNTEELKALNDALESYSLDCEHALRNAGESEDAILRIVHTVAALKEKLLAAYHGV